MGTGMAVGNNQVPATQTQITTSVTANNMQYTVQNTDNKADSPTPPTILLQRLANPNIAYQPVSTNPGYNPYVTVDYVDMNQVGTATGKTVVNDARQYNTGKPRDVGAEQRSTQPFFFGRNQPYGAVEAQAPSGSNRFTRQPASPSAKPCNQPTTSFSTSRG